MNWIREHKGTTTVLVVILLLVVVIVLSHRYVGRSTFLGQGIEKLVTVVQQPLSLAGNGTKDGARGILQFRSVLKENEELNDQVAELRRELIKARLTEEELNELRELSDLLKYETITAEYDPLTADVIAMDGSNWFNIFTINVGSAEGVYRDAVIVKGGNLVGRVLEVGDHWAKVISVIEETNAVSFTVYQDMNLLGVLSGDGDSGKLKGYMIDPDAAIMEGHILVTSGMGMYPSGIVIGNVSEVKWNSDTLLKTVSIEPAVYFKNLQKVTVLIKR